MFPAFNFEKGKPTQQLSLSIINKIVLNHVCVYHETVYANNVRSKFWVLRFFSAQHHSIIIANITSEKVSQVRTKKCQTRSFISKVNLKFLSSSRPSNCNTIFAVTMFFVDENILSFNNICNRKLETRFRIVEL